MKRTVVCAAALIAAASPAMADDFTVSVGKPAEFDLAAPSGSAGHLLLLRVHPNEDLAGGARITFETPGGREIASVRARGESGRSYLFAMPDDALVRGENGRLAAPIRARLLPRDVPLGSASFAASLMDTGHEPPQ